jgi:hypothetical protein
LLWGAIRKQRQQEHQKEDQSTSHS